MAAGVIAVATAVVLALHAVFGRCFAVSAIRGTTRYEIFQCGNTVYFQKCAYSADGGSEIWFFEPETPFFLRGSYRILVSGSATTVPHEAGGVGVLAGVVAPDYAMDFPGVPCCLGLQVRIRVEYFIVPLLAAGASLIWLGRGPSPRPGLCAQCGYDLRASKERCPECGTPIPLDKTRNRPSGKDLKPPETDPPGEPLPPG